MKKSNSLIALMALVCGTGSVFAQTKIIAHRGYWTCPGSAQNSIAALNKTHEIKAYGAEFDVHLTKDGIAVVNHDDSIQGFHIEETDYAQLKNLELSNGEKLPTLEQYLVQGKKNKGTQLILEIKPHKTREAEDRAVTTILAMVKKHKVENMTEYISFSMNICKELIRQAKGAQVAYLKSDIPPAELKKMGFTGIDYYYKAMEQHPEWVKEAHDNGLSVNVWTVNDSEMMQSFIAQGVDYITTNEPVILAELLKK